MLIIVLNLHDAKCAAKLLRFLWAFLIQSISTSLSIDFVFFTNDRIGNRTPYDNESLLRAASSWADYDGSSAERTLTSGPIPDRLAPSFSGVPIDTLDGGYFLPLFIFVRLKSEVAHGRRCCSQGDLKGGTLQSVSGWDIFSRTPMTAMYKNGNHNEVVVCLLNFRLGDATTEGFSVGVFYVDGNRRKPVWLWMKSLFIEKL